MEKDHHQKDHLSTGSVKGKRDKSPKPSRNILNIFKKKEPTPKLFDTKSKEDEDEEKPSILDLIEDFDQLGLEDSFEFIKTLSMAEFNKHSLDDRKIDMHGLFILLSRLPEGSKLGRDVQNKLMVAMYNTIEQPVRKHVGYQYRSANGSGNSVLYPHVGQAGSTYARSVVPRHHVKTLPDPAKIFDTLLVRKEFKPNVSNLNSLISYFATLATHDLFYTDPVNPFINTTSSYLDLSPLYGRNLEEQKHVRSFEKGLLKPDAFSDVRFGIQPAGLTAIIVILSRHHNFIAKKLLEINEFQRFANSELTPEKQDEELFQTARLINCACYLNVILHDYLRSIIGLDRESKFFMDPYSDKDVNPVYGNQNSYEFNLIYHWHPLISKKDDEWIAPIMNTFAAEVMAGIKANKPLDRVALGEKLTHIHPPEIKPEANGAYKHSDLLNIIIHGSKETAGSFGPFTIPASMRPFEIHSIMQARKAGMGTFNEFREFLELKPLTSFEQLTSHPEGLAAIKQLYAHIDDVELYVGLMVEDCPQMKRKSDGMGLGYTLSRGILTDALHLVRNDRFFTDDYTPHNYTSWGYFYSKGDPDYFRGSALPNIIKNAFPEGTLSESALKDLCTDFFRVK